MVMLAESLEKYVIAHFFRGSRNAKCSSLISGLRDGKCKHGFAFQVVISHGFGSDLIQYSDFSTQFSAASVEVYL